MHCEYIYIYILSHPLAPDQRVHSYGGGAGMKIGQELRNILPCCETNNRAGGAALAQTPEVPFNVTLNLPLCLFSPQGAVRHYLFAAVNCFLNTYFIMKT